MDIKWIENIIWVLDTKGYKGLKFYVVYVTKEKK